MGVFRGMVVYCMGLMHVIMVYCLLYGINARNYGVVFIIWD